MVVFDRLGDGVLDKIVDKNLTLLNQQLEEKEITLALDAGARGYLAKKGYDPVMGARPMARLFQDTLRDLITDAIIDESIHAGDTVLITLKDEKLEIAKITQTGKKADLPRVEKTPAKAKAPAKSAKKPAQKRVAKKP